MTRTRILVTGSQGFVGKHLRQALLARNCEVIGVDRPGTGAEFEQNLSDKRFDAHALAKEIGPVGGIIYMAATITRGSSVDEIARDNLQAISVASVETMDAWNELHGPTHFVFCSTYKGYGPPTEQPIQPERPPQRPDPHSYGSAKALAERLLAISAARTQAKYAIVRPTCIYGPGQHLHNAIPLFLKACLEGKNPVVFGEGRDIRDDVLAPDLAYCLAEACLRKVEGPFHAAGEKARTIFEVAELCCRAVSELGGKSDLTPITDPTKPPKWWLDQTFDLRRTQQLLDYTPTPLLEGLKAEARWIRDGAAASRSIDYFPPRSIPQAHP